jgi:hypothetical protein
MTDRDGSLGGLPVRRVRGDSPKGYRREGPNKRGKAQHISLTNERKSE